MIEAINLTKRYEDGNLALDHLDLQVSAGEIYCLLGANGAGKTTTINLMLNFIEPTEGTVRINGIDMTRDPLRAKKYVAYLSENVMLYGDFTALQNLAFFSRLGGRDDLGRTDLRRILLQVGLPPEALERRVKDFSKGMRQKLGIAIAVAKDAPALLFDEPMSGLDPKAAAELVQTLEELRAQGKAILMSTHDIFRTKELADRVGIMKDGRKVAELSRDALQRIDLERLYLEHMRAAGEIAEKEIAPLRAV
ncbi:MAG TPA: ABC transporter ATP-binding protein [Thermoanaerobaculia bacterium]|nr:ABC transporter ATP-binding protein [Thermoanaerobaculia bacterium]